MPRKINWATDSFAAYKAPGLNGIFPAILQVTKAPCLYEIYSACLLRPIQWRTSRIVFLPKAGKCSHVSTKDYRPISLTSSILKTREKLLDLHIRNDVGRLMSSNQHAYTKGKSVETALHSLVVTVGRALHIKE